MTRERAGERAKQLAQDAMQEIMLNDLINQIFFDFNNRECENCKYGGASTMNYTACNNKEVSPLFLDGRLPDDMACKKWVSQYPLDIKTKTELDKGKE